MWMTAALWASMALAGECPTRVDTSAIDAALDKAEQAFAELDAVAFERAADDAAFQLPCVTNLVSPTVAARYHRIVAIRWFLTGDESNTLHALAAAASADPSYTFPPSIVPEGHELGALYTRARASDDQRVPVPEPKNLRLFGDGVALDDRSTTRPTWLQLVQDGEVTTSTYLLPGDLLPDYEGKPLPTAPTPLPNARRGNPTWLVASGTSAVASAALYGAALQSKSRFYEDVPGITQARLEEIRTRTNTLGAASVASLGLAAACGVSFAVTR